MKSHEAKKTKKLEDRAYSYNSKGKEHLEKNNYIDALDTFNQAIKINPWLDPNMYYNRGCTLLLIAEHTDSSGTPEAINRLSLAIKDFTTIIEHIESYFNFSYSTSSPEFKNLLTLCYLHRGGIQRNLGRFDEAIYDFNKVISFKNDRHACALFERGVTFYKMTLIKHSSPKKNEIPEVQANLSIHETYAIALNDFEEAIKHVKNEDASSLKLKAHINSYQGHVFLRQNKLDSALNFYELAIKTDPKSLNYIAAEKENLFFILKTNKENSGTDRLKECLTPGTILYKIIMHPRGDTPCSIKHGTAKKINDELKKREREDDNNNTKSIRRTLSFSNKKSILPSLEQHTVIKENNPIINNDAKKSTKRRFLDFISKEDSDENKSTTMTSLKEQNDFDKLSKKP